MKSRNDMLYIGRKRKKKKKKKIDFYLKNIREVFGLYHSLSSELRIRLYTS